MERIGNNRSEWLEWSGVTTGSASASGFVTSVGCFWISPGDMRRHQQDIVCCLECVYRLVELIAIS